MKKILLIMVATFMSVTFVKADTNIDLIEQDFIPLNSLVSGCNYNDLYYYTDFNTFISNTENKEIFDTLYNTVKEYYLTNYQATYPDYTISVNIISSSSSEFSLYSIYLNLVYLLTGDNAGGSIAMYYTPSNGYVQSSTSACSKTVPSIGYPGYSLHYDSIWNYVLLNRFEASYKTLIGQPIDTLGNLTFNINNSITYTSSDYYPTFLTSTYDDYLSNNYIEVNLDDYEYVILNLKDYSKTEAFNTNLKVKGMIGITPVYEFGTVEKENVTDRCNLSYEDFTDYRFTILKNDLFNNAVYYVKGCEDGSSFKFDSSIFNITYVTADNVDAPSITVGDNTYNIIPFNKLSTTANSNEDNNYIPGESGSSLTDIINNTSNYISSFWNSLVTIMGLATKFFNTLPIEIRSISITAFITALTLGIIKFIKS